MREKTQQLRKKGVSGVKNVIYGRTLFVISAFLVQFVVIIAGFFWLSAYGFITYLLFLVIGLSVILHLFNSKGSPDFKMVWMLPMVVFPIFGALLYVYVDIQPETRILFHRLQKLSEYTQKYVPENEKTRETLSKEDAQMGNFAGYMQKSAHCPVYQQTTVKYYPLGDDQFPDLVEDLMNAKKFIFLEFFIVEEGYMWDTIRSVLKKKVKEGVEVRVMYDGMCVLALLPYYYPELLKEDGIKCKMFTPIKPVFSTHYNNRDHRKIAVIDGKVAYTGGTNLADEYINKKERFGHWKDTAVRLKGKAVERFTYMFLEMWNVTEQEQENYGLYKTPLEYAAADDGYFIPYDVCPYGDERVGRSVYLDILNTAKSYVHIMTPYLILDHEMIMALTYAAKRGVDVHIIMPHIPDKKYAFYLAKTYYEELIEAGVKISEYTPGFVHAKVFVADDCKAVVGSINLDYRSLYHHFECAVFMYQNSQIPVIEHDFQNTLKSSQNITRKDCKNLPLHEKLIGKFLRMFAALM
ncbi:MAG: cardiolipin synthase [Lachnospiraceae bacterium]